MRPCHWQHSLPDHEESLAEGSVRLCLKSRSAFFSISWQLVMDLKELSPRIMMNTKAGIALCMIVIYLGLNFDVIILNSVCLLLGFVC